MDKPEFIVTRITDGLEFGEGTISGHGASAETLRIVDEIIHTNPNILVAIDDDTTGETIEDDGCGDGRETGLVFRGAHSFKRSLNRAKVFGGALVMATAGRIGMGRAAGVELTTVFEQSMAQLQDHDLDFGAHTADHVTEGREDIDCGCGAIDGAPKIIAAAVTYEEPIRASIKALGIEDTGLDTVFANYRAYAETLPNQNTFSGRAVMDQIVKAGKVVKQLVGAHKECRIVLNNVRSFTVNQALVRTVTNDEAQVFAVDIWRLTDIANKMYEDLPDAQRTALQSEIVYTLATAAVLTKGDLPVDVIQEVA